jgi:hypothetical protein
LSLEIEYAFLGPEPDARDIINWDYIGATLGASVEKVGEEVTSGGARGDSTR